jgi:hypothetical protein
VRLWKDIPAMPSGSSRLDPEWAKQLLTRASAIQLPCFSYRGEDLSAPLALEPGGGPEELVRCPVRRRLYRLTPEERARQALIWFLREGADQAAALA